MAQGKRRANGKNVRQKGHGKQRPRAFRRGVAQGEINDERLRAVSPAFAAAEADRLEVERRTAAHRESVRDWEALLDGCSRVSGSCALAPLPALLLV